MKTGKWIKNRKHDRYLKELYEKEYGFFFNVANRILSNSSDAEDAISDAFIKISNNIEKIISLPCHKRLPYCVIIVKNSSYDIIRKNGKIQSSDKIIEIADQKLASDNIANDDTAEKVFDGIKKKDLGILLKNLDNAEFQLIRLRYFDDLSFKDIGRGLNISEALARKRHERIIKKLRKLTEDKGIKYEEF